MSTWQALYYSDLQSLWALLVVPFGFLAFRLVAGSAAQRSPTPRETAFIGAYCLAWTVETMLDPIIGGPVSQALGWSNHFAGTIVMFLFVLLGDLRVFVLVFGLAGGGRVPWPRTLGLLFVVPLTTGILYGTAAWWNPEIHGQVMWLTYELSFVGMTIWLARKELPPNLAEDRPELAAMLRTCLGYVAAYYSLWAACDVLILLDIEEGWALRMVPNQLYYALWVPFVYLAHAHYSGRASSGPDR